MNWILLIIAGIFEVGFVFFGGKERICNILEGVFYFNFDSPGNRSKNSVELNHGIASDRVRFIQIAENLYWSDLINLNTVKTKKIQVF